MNDTHRPDLLLTHGYFLCDDPAERKTMKPYPPLGLLYLSASLKRDGHRVSVFDGTFDRPGAFNQQLERCKPPVVGIYCNMMTRRRAVWMIRQCRELDCTVVVGGPDPANYADEYLRHGADIVVIGEGERTLAELLDSLRAGRGGPPPDHVRGIAYLMDGRIRHTGARPAIVDLDELPHPDRAALDIDAYIDAWRRRHGVGPVSLITARGCPYRCNWCSHAVFGHSHRRRSPANVADEVESIAGRYAPDMLWYADDVFTINHRWMKQYHAELESRRLRFPFETISREDRLNEEIIRLLADMGCDRLWIGAESGSQRILDRMQRQTRSERVVELVDLLRQHGIRTGLFIMLGYQSETESDLRETVEFLKRASPDTYLTTTAYPIKGTPYHDAVEAEIIRPGAWAEISDRDLRLASQQSDSYYAHASRWIRGEVDYHIALKSRPRRMKHLAISYARAQVGRMGMRMAGRQSDH